MDTTKDINMDTTKDINMDTNNAADMYFVKSFSIGCGIKIDTTVYELERQMGQDHLDALAFALGSQPFGTYTYHSPTISAVWDVARLRVIFYDPKDGNRMIGYYVNRKYRCVSPAHVKEIQALLPPHTEPYTVGNN
jgi:hypothetical protein